VNAPLLVAGVLALVGATVHGLGGQLLVVRRLSSRALPPSPFGGPSMTKTMIQVTWHMTTIAFTSAGIAEIYAAVVSDGASRGVELLAAATVTAFAALAIGAGLRRGPTALLRHPGPLVLATTAGLAWWGAL
jgi:hypothetical protein